MKGEHGGLWKQEEAPNPALGSGKASQRKLPLSPNRKELWEVEVGRERAQGKARGIPSLPEEEE